MERKIGLSSRRAFSNASSPHGYQSTGLWACCNKYGLFSLIKRLVYCPSRVTEVLSFFCCAWFRIKAKAPPPTNNIPRRPAIKAFLLLLGCIFLIQLIKDKDISLSVEAPFLARSEFHNTLQCKPLLPSAGYFKASSALRISSFVGRSLKFDSILAQATFPCLSM